jgi:hypothetical protein
LQIEHGIRIAHLRDNPTRANIQDRGYSGCAHTAPDDEVQLSDIRRVHLLDFRIWKAECELAIPASTFDRQLNEPDAALLNQSTARPKGQAPSVKDGMGATKGWMSRKRKFASRSKNPQAIVGFVYCWWKDERSFREIGPSRDSLHLFGVQTLRVQQHGYRISAKRLVGKNVNYFICSFHIRLIKPHDRRREFATGAVDMASITMKAYKEGGSGRASRHPADPIAIHAS